MVMFMWSALSDEKTSLSFVYAAGPSQRSLSQARVLWDSRPYFTVSDLKLPFSSPPTTRRIKVEVFDPASTRVPAPRKEDTFPHGFISRRYGFQPFRCLGILNSLIYTACINLSTRSRCVATLISDVPCIWEVVA
jgi:hypothetical protein